MPRFILLFVLCCFFTSAHAQQVTRYEIDPAHTRVVFTVKHLGFSWMPGVFNDITGTLNFNPADVSQSALDVKINAKSVSMGHKVLDKKLQEPQYFDTARYPVIRFRATHIETTGLETGNVTGNLTFLGITKPVKLHVRFNRKAWNTFMNTDVVGFTAWGKINRSDFGMKTMLPDVGDEVKLRIAVEAFVPTLDMKLKKHPELKKAMPEQGEDKAVPLLLPGAPGTGGVKMNTKPNNASPFTAVPAPGDNHAQ